jgi:hypothetical protein
LIGWCREADWVGCDEVLRLLQEREAACLGEVERLRGEAERIAELLRVCEQELARLSTARQVVGELPVVAHAVACPVRPEVPAQRSDSGRRPTDATDAALAFGERALGVLAGYPGPVRCRQVVEGLGLEVTARNVERVRHHLKKAVAAGRALSTPGGLFTLARARTAAGG